MPRWSLALGIAACVALVAPAHGSDPMEIVSLPSPAPEGSQTGNLVAAGDGVSLSWLEKRSTGHALRFARWDGEAFAEPRTIHTSDAFFANWADFSSMLTLDDGRLVAHWLEKAAEGTYEYDVWISLSDDDGRHWSEPRRPHRDGTLSEHGFVSMARHGRDGFAAVWLDGREFKKGADDNEMTLRFTTYEGGGFQEERALDGRVCECCQTDMAPTNDGFVVVYRDRSLDEIRDIGVVRYADGAWTEPAIVHDDGWRIAGCPVNGPQVTASGDRVAVAWFTAADDDPKVQVVFSSDGGATFGEPVRIDEGGPAGRVDIVSIGDDVVVSWLERGESGRADVRLERVSPSGSSEVAILVAETGSSRASGFPRMAVYGSEVYVTWTDTLAGERPSQVRLAKVALD